MKIVREGIRCLAISAVGCAISALAQAVQSVSSVQDGAGGRSAGGDYALVASAAQPGGVRFSGDGAAGGWRHQAGFLGTFVMQPGLDHDGNGLPDELDDDNDGDGLGDVAELTGSDFDAAWGVAATTDPNDADSDQDGAGDAHELGAGTDPNDADSIFAIIGIQHEAGGTRVSWQGRGAGTRYQVLSRDGSYQPPVDLLEEVAVDGGDGAPWFTTNASVLDAAGADVRHYGVEKQ